MSDTVTQETLDIFARRVLARAELLQTQEVFQENYATPPAPPGPLGTKAPLTLYIINHGADVTTDVPNTDYGSPVKCVKLCKRILQDEPANTILCTQKSKVAIDFQLVLIVEFEDDTFDVLTLPKNLSSMLHVGANTKAFVDPTVIDSSGIPVIQHQNVVQPYEQMVIKPAGVNAYTYFEYTVSIPLANFSEALRKCELNDPSLQSYIVLRNLAYDTEVLDQYLVTTNTETGATVWTTIVEFSLFEDIIDKLGIDQDIEIVGTPEYVCEDSSCDCCG